MVEARRLAAALVVSLTLASPALAQIDTTIAGLRPGASPARLLPHFALPAGDFRDVGAPSRNGLIAAVPLRENLQIGIGRFRVAEPARARTHMEPERAPTDLRRKERGVAAVGMSLRF